jgi:predicted small lipoprotein YifL
MKKSINILVALAALFTLVSCVHEFPDPVDAEVRLNLQYDA